VAELSPESEALMIAYVYGELSESAAAAFEEQLADDPALRAEVDGLVATRDLLDSDARYGATSGLDEPPPHLQEAIFRAEALARPAALRQASIQAGALEQPPPLLHRLSTWLLGGGLALGAAAAALLVVTSGGDLQAPTAEVASPTDEAPAKMAAASEQVAADRADRAAAPPGAAPAEDAPTYEIGEVFGEAKEEADAEREPDSVAQRGLASGPSLGLRDDLDAPATITAGKGAGGGGVAVKVAEAPRTQVASADKADDRKPAPAPPRGYSKDAPASKKPSVAAPARKAKRKSASSRRARSAASDDDLFGGPPPLPSAATRAGRERRAFEERAKNKKKASKSAATRDSVEGMHADVETTESMQAGDAMMKRGRYAEAAEIYRSAARSRPASETHIILARFIEASFRAGRHRDAVVGYKRLKRLMKGEKPEGDLRKAYVYAAQSAERLGDEALAEQIFAEARDGKKKKAKKATKAP
jgi:anti-sigma factor RsiW